LPFAEAAADAGIRTVTFDLRGYGDSEGERSDQDAPTDIEAVVTFVDEQLGAENIILIGAVQSGTAAAKVASANEAVDGLVVLSAPRTTAADGLTVTDDELQAITMPSLWIAARQDLLQEVEALHEAAGSADKTLWIYETSAVPGTELFNGLDAIDLEQRLIGFITQFE
jgi:pimeloyl-ACP methyl ester carboxylesterase